MSGSQSAKFKPQEIALLMGLAIFIVAMVVGVSLLAWPKIEANWFAGPTPEADIRPLLMTNEEINGCVEPDSKTILPGPYDPEAIIPAVRDLMEAGIIGEVEPLLERIMAEQAAPYWVWSDGGGLEYTIIDPPAKVTYRMALYCVSAVLQADGSTHIFPLFDTVEVDPLMEPPTND